MFVSFVGFVAISPAFKYPGPARPESVEGRGTAGFDKLSPNGHFVAGFKRFPCLPWILWQ
ncbi:hypothetical protein GCM10011419_19700 [Vogesella fluminis]|uniref:Uncharacterized protein n=1 Tax=Vogesella fluminis TaxID=1069161 RepID=A0ABQ3HCG5_9NEIS|nr:hypothetical protein GCM10011419_19700 [Vogesella fluminis]